MTPDNPTNHLELVKGQSDKKFSSPGVLRHIEEEALQAGRRLVDHMFSATDDLFYELSKRATSNNEQNLYFESMREIRVKKEGLIATFLQRLESCFEGLLNPALKPVTSNDVDADHLSIVEGDELEIDLALKNMSSRARESYKNELYELCIRLDHLLLQASVNEENNPLDPQQISSAFVKTCVEKLNISIKTRLILFKLFEKHVLKQLGHIYADANQLLIETGILPKVPKSLHKSSTARVSENSPPVDDATMDNDPNNPIEGTNTQPHSSGNTISLTPSTLASLMAAIRNAGNQAKDQNYYFYANNPGPALAAQDLASILATRQAIVDHKMAKSEPKVVLRDLVKELLQKNSPNKPNSLGQSDEDTINLVAMFFDEILEEADLPLAVQSLVCRLQIPVLKVALKDKRFLADNQHPVRELINTITRAGIQLDESKSLERDPLYRTIVDGIQSINRQHTQDDSVFNQVRTEIEALLAKESRKSVIVESRTNQTEVGKAKVRNAKAFAQTSLFDKLKGEKLPELISQFFTNTWLQVLVITYIKEGKEGSLWIENEQLISDLIWLCKSHNDERSKARAQRLKPEILNRIEAGLELAIDNPATRKSRIEEIEQTIETVVQGGANEDMVFKCLDDKQKESLGKSDPAEKSWDEMTALERQQSQHEELSSKYYLEAKNLPEGTWVEYQQDDGKISRCKLSKKIDADTYIFVNRFGFKTTQKSRRAFAYDMQFNKAKLLDSGPVFDRVLDHIMARFQQESIAAQHS